jgi:hypothetical protein
MPAPPERSKLLRQAARNIGAEIPALRCFAHLLAA